MSGVAVQRDACRDDAASCRRGIAWPRSGRRPRGHRSPEFRPCRSSKEISANSVGVRQALNLQHHLADRRCRASGKPGRWAGRPSCAQACGSVMPLIGPSPTFSPSRRQTKQSATRKISSNLCEMKMIARPAAFSCAMMRNRSSISLRDRAAVGSSMMMTGRLMATAPGRFRPGASAPPKAASA